LPEKSYSTKTKNIHNITKREKEAAVEVG